MSKGKKSLLWKVNFFQCIFYFFNFILKGQYVKVGLHTVGDLEMPHCSWMPRTCAAAAAASTLLTCCWTKSLPIGDTIHLHFLSWLGDRGFHHVSLLVHEETQRNHPAVWETHQSPSPCRTLTGWRRDNRSPPRPTVRAHLNPDLRRSRRACASYCM